MRILCQVKFNLSHHSKSVRLQPKIIFTRQWFSIIIYCFFSVFRMSEIEINTHYYPLKCKLTCADCFCCLTDSHKHNDVDFTTIENSQKQKTFEKLVRFSILLKNYFSN